MKKTHLAIGLREHRKAVRIETSGLASRVSVPGNVGCCCLLESGQICGVHKTTKTTLGDVIVSTQMNNTEFLELAQAFFNGTRAKSNAIPLPESKGLVI